MRHFIFLVKVLHCEETVQSKLVLPFCYEKHILILTCSLYIENLSDTFTKYINICCLFQAFWIWLEYMELIQINLFIEPLSSRCLNIPPSPPPSPTHVNYSLKALNSLVALNMAWFLNHPLFEVMINIFKKSLSKFSIILAKIVSKIVWNYF